MQILDLQRVPGGHTDEQGDACKLYPKRIEQDWFNSNFNESRASVLGDDVNKVLRPSMLGNFVNPTLPPALIFLLPQRVFFVYFIPRHNQLQETNTFEINIL